MQQQNIQEYITKLIKLKFGKTAEYTLAGIFSNFKMGTVTSKKTKGGVTIGTTKREAITHPKSMKSSMLSNIWKFRSTGNTDSGYNTLLQMSGSFGTAMNFIGGNLSLPAKEGPGLSLMWQDAILIAFGALLYRFGTVDPRWIGGEDEKNARIVVGNANVYSFCRLDLSQTNSTQVIEQGQNNMTATIFLLAQYYHEFLVQNYGNDSNYASVKNQGLDFNSQIFTPALQGNMFAGFQQLISDLVYRERIYMYNLESYLDFKSDVDGSGIHKLNVMNFMPTLMVHDLLTTVAGKGGKKQQHAFSEAQNILLLAEKNKFNMISDPHKDWRFNHTLFIDEKAQNNGLSNVVIVAANNIFSGKSGSGNPITTLKSLATGSYVYVMTKHMSTGSYTFASKALNKGNYYKFFTGLDNSADSIYNSNAGPDNYANLPQDSRLLFLKSVLVYDSSNLDKEQYNEVAKQLVAAFSVGIAGGYGSIAEYKTASPVARVATSNKGKNFGITQSQGTLSINNAQLTSVVSATRGPPVITDNTFVPQQHHNPHMGHGNSPDRLHAVNPTLPIDNQLRTEMNTYTGPTTHTGQSPQRSLFGQGQGPRRASNLVLDDNENDEE